MVSYGVGCRRGSDPALLWLWHRLAAAASIRPLAWEPPYALVAALEKDENKQTKKSISLIFKYSLDLHFYSTVI